MSVVNKKNLIENNQDRKFVSRESNKVLRPLNVFSCGFRLVLRTDRATEYK